MSKVSDRITNLSADEKRALLEKLLRRKAREMKPFPLSFAQERMWFLHQLDPDSPFYNIPVAVRLTGKLDLAALERALSEIVARHEALRTAFPTTDGVPAQTVYPAKPVTLPVEDLSNLPESERENRAILLITEEAQTPFDLTRGPLLRFRLLKLSDKEHVACFTMHHIVSDGWSMGVLVREVATLYDSFSRGEQSPLADLPVQYADYAKWQREWLQGAALDDQLGYWKRQLANTPPLLELPTDRPRPAVQSFVGANESLELPASLCESLKAFSLREGVTLFMTLIAAFKVLLYRYSGQDHVAVGTPIAGRTRAELENLIGFFVNTLVMSTDVSGEPSFREFVKRVKRTALGAFSHQDVPFEKLVEELQPPRSLSHAPLFQVMFTLQKAPDEEFHLPGLTLSSMAAPSGTAKFDLTLSMSESEEGFAASFEYNTDLFDAATVRRMLNHLKKLLTGIAADPDQSITRLPMLEVDERRQILVEWNHTHREYPRDLCIQELFEHQAEINAEAIALAYENEELSYRDLNRRANQLANYLIKLGVTPEARVGICMERGINMVVGLLGILKAGAAYVPLDPTYPRERLAYMLDEAQASALLTQNSLLEKLPQDSARVVRLDADGDAISDEDDGATSSGVRGDNLAYVIYTSGSTGRPKGVAIEHNSAVTLIHWAAELFRDSDLAGVLASTSICFDLSVFEIFVPLSRGGKVILAENALRLPSLACAGQVTLVNTVPSAMEELVRNKAVPSSVRVVNLAGETLHAKLVQQIYQQETIEAVYNLYGPSEDTTYSTFAALKRESNQAPPIGRPIANTQVYLLDSYMEPVPVGVSGELYIGGDGLARGYLNRPELTAERFIPDPFSRESGGRLYRTGDLARYKSDGNIEFLGRLDHQVKIRGFRIELGEIETVLSHHAAVREAVVVAREITPGDKRLVAYLVPADDSSLNAEELSNFLRDRLPEYMIPPHFVFLDAMPRTLHGKVDRRSLPDPERGQAQKASYVPPRDNLELELVRVWEDVLGVKPVGVKDNFFSLGGHSLLAFRLRAQIDKIFGRNLPLAVLFQGPTIEHLASRLRKQSETHSWSPMVKIQSGESSRPFFCVHPAGGSVVCYMALARYLGPAQDFYAFRSRGIEAEQTLLTSVEDMAGEYLEAMREAQPEGPYLLGGWSVGGVIAYEMAQQLHAKGEEVALLVMMDAHAPYPDQEAIEGDDLTLIVNFGWNLGITLDFDAQAWKRLERLALSQQLSTVLEWARNASVLPPDLSLSQLRRLFEVFKTNVRAMHRYEPQKTKAPIALLKASELVAGSSREPALGWKKFAGGDLQIHEVPGNHFNMVYEPHVQTLAKLLDSCLREASTSRQ